MKISNDLRPLNRNKENWKNRRNEERIEMRSGLQLQIPFPVLNNLMVLILKFCRKLCERFSFPANTWTTTSQLEIYGMDSLSCIVGLAEDAVEGIQSCLQHQKVLSSLYGQSSGIDGTCLLLKVVMQLLEYNQYFLALKCLLYIMSHAMLNIDFEL